MASIAGLKAEISKFLKDRWGYSKHQIEVYFQKLKSDNSEITVELLEKEWNEMKDE